MNINGISNFSIGKPNLTQGPSFNQGLDSSKMLNRLQQESDVKGPNFQDTMTQLVGQINEVSQAPDALMHQAMTTGNVDVHDVMVANAKAELLINVTTQVATKVVQAYDRILQIQI